jgi:hypothetical protein
MLVESGRTIGFCFGRLRLLEAFGIRYSLMHQLEN